MIIVNSHEKINKWFNKVKYDEIIFLIRKKCQISLIKPIMVVV